MIVGDRPAGAAPLAHGRAIDERRGLGDAKKPVGVAPAQLAEITRAIFSTPNARKDSSIVPCH